METHDNPFMFNAELINVVENLYKDSDERLFALMHKMFDLEMSNGE